MTDLVVSKKSPYYKEFKADVEFFNGRKIGQIPLIDLKLATERFFEKKLEKARIKLLEEIYMIKLT